MAIQIEACYRVTTPLFGGGARPGSTAELRATSIKGVLRYWWRALAWSRTSGDSRAVHAWESSLFGSAEGGVSRVRLAVEVPAEVRTLGSRGTEVLKDSSQHKVGPGARYLGYGLLKAYGKDAGKLERPCLGAPFQFSLRVRLYDVPAVKHPGARRDRLPSFDEDRETLLQALQFLGLAGGLGARSRKGWGSVCLMSLLVNDEPVWEAPRTAADLRARLQDLFTSAGPGPETWPLWTALSRHARAVVLGACCSDALVALDHLGREMVRYRSWGHRGTILDGEPREGHFQDDHDLMKLPFEQRHRHPRRVAFGLPHNYGGVTGAVTPVGRLDRRASPLFLHVHDLEGQGFAAVALHMPAKFLPDGQRNLSVGGKTVELQPEEDLYQPVEAFLDRLLGAGRKESFDPTLEVRP